MKPDKISQIFDTLDRWKALPAYQLERRVDIFFAIYLKKIIKRKFQIEVSHIIPEFPVRKGTIYGSDNNQSEKIDYVAIANNKVYFVELKTEMASKREHQDLYLRLAKEANIPKLIDGLLRIYPKTKEKKKYKALFNELIEIGWLNRKYENISMDCDIEVIYLQPILTQNDSPRETITFKEVIEAIKDEEDLITQRFVQSLQKWEIEAKEKEKKKRRRIRS